MRAKEGTAVKRVVLVTNQYCESKNKAGFHWLADAFWRAGWEVLFFTESISWISWLRRDSRFAYPIVHQANRLRQVRERYWSYVWLTPYHPLNLRRAWLNRLSGPLLKTYGSLPLREAETMVAQAPECGIESNPSRALSDIVRSARFCAGTPFVMLSFHLVSEAFQQDLCSNSFIRIATRRYRRPCSTTLPRSP